MNKTPVRRPGSNVSLVILTDQPLNQPFFIMQNPPNILIAGAGFVGSCLADLLAETGIDSFPLRRSPAATNHHPRIHPIQADLLRPESLRSTIPASITHVVFCAGADASSLPAYNATYLQAQQNLAALLQHHHNPITHWIFVSSSRVYGDQAGAWVNEQTAATPSDPLGHALLQAEQFSQSLPWRSTIVRFSGIYGPGRKRLLNACLQQKTALPPPGIYSNRIHRLDGARALHHLIHAHNPPPVLLASDREPVETRTFLQWIYQQLEREPPLSPTHPESDRRPNNKRCSSDLLLQTGFQFQYPSFRNGYPPLIQALQNR